ncbi:MULTISPECIES: YcnI family protein [unclassified Phenylobacterium]|uniref:YcnI family copper-binding membrane protein n=1 Tax=unclassified Phenylobacterium TaxID=2640670 RepID=UPI001F40168A|nr:MULTISPECIES: YcnI family protein [unclassified Phenylobacterium]
MGVLRTLMIGAAAIAALPAAAAAHVVADPGRASAGAYQAVVFRVGHGCGEAATTALRIEIPPQMASARPQPKPGWALEIERQDGKVTALTWRGELPADQFDEFAVLFKLPDEAANLYFPTVQSCGAEQSQWTEIPAPGERASHPAPALVVTPKAASAEAHQH